MSEALRYCDENYSIILADHEENHISPTRLFSYLEVIATNMKQRADMFADFERKRTLTGRYEAYKGEEPLFNFLQGVVQFETETRENIENLKKKMIAFLQMRPQDSTSPWVSYLPYSHKACVDIQMLKGVNLQTSMGQFHEKNPAHKKGYELSDNVTDLLLKLYDPDTTEEKDKDALRQKIDLLEKQAEQLLPSVGAELQALREGKQW